MVSSIKIAGYQAKTDWTVLGRADIPDKKRVIGDSVMELTYS
jgi:hypothetical protein